MNRIKLVIVAALALGASTAMAAQVSQDDYRCPRSPFYGRTDGVCFDATTKTPALVHNGTAETVIDGPTYSYDFSHATTAAAGVSPATIELDGTVRVVTAEAIHLAYFGNGLKLVYIPLVEETIDINQDAASLDIAGDQTSNDGYELAAGMLGASGRPFLIGTDPAFKFCATVGQTTTAGVDNMVIGFRKLGVFAPAFDTYTDYAGIGNIAGDIKISTDIGNAGVTTTDTTNNVADATAVKYCTLVSSAGVVTYTLNDSPPIATAAYTFTDAQLVIPFLTFLQTATKSAEVDLTLWEVSYQ